MENEFIQSQSKEKQAIFIYGAMLYDENTKGNKKAIPRSKLSKFNTPILYSIYNYIVFTDTIDLEKDNVAIETINNIVSVLNERDPLPEITPEQRDECYKRFLALLENMKNEN